MKKLLLGIICMCLPVLAHAELKKVPFNRATANSEQSLTGNEGPASLAIDGDPGTFWSSAWNNQNAFPYTLTVEFTEPTHVDMLRYVPRSSGGSNGIWNKVKVTYGTGTVGALNKELGEFDLGGSSDSYLFSMGENGVDKVKRVQFTVTSGVAGMATAAEIEALVIDNTREVLWKEYFEDAAFSVLKAGVTSSEGIEDADLKALVDNLLADADGYRKFRVAEYEPYRDVYDLQRELKTSSVYNRYENPSGIYLKAGEECYVVLDGAEGETVGLSIKNWLDSEAGSSYALSPGLNKITATTEGNVFVSYYTDNYKTAPNVKVHFVNAPVRGYWDKETMTNADWKAMLAKLPSDNSIIVVRSKHAQLVYPVSAWKSYCPENIDSLMSLYTQVQWAERDMMGLEKYGRQIKNRQLFYATNYGFMAAGGDGAYCNVNSLKAIMTPDARQFGFWAVGHEWGHNNQIDGFKWSGCGETTNNIYASWAEINFNHQAYCRLEDENSGIDAYSGMRGGRMQTYFEEALRKGVQWQLQDGPDYHGTVPSTVTVIDYDYDGKYLGVVTTTSRNYDHFVKLVPLWQLNLWGTLAGKSPDIYPMFIEHIRQADDYRTQYNTNGKLQMNFMKVVCDSTKLNFLPFFEKAGLLRPISAYIEDYNKGWNKISQQMIDELKQYVADKGYTEITEEVNYITAHNYQIYRDKLPLEVPATLGTGCTPGTGMVTVLHSAVKNAVAYETYNSHDELVAITMYALGSDAGHTYTQVLYPGSDEESEASAYIMAVGFDGTRKKIYEKSNLVPGLKEGKYYTFTSVGKGGALSCGANTVVEAASGSISWNLSRAGKTSAMDQLWTIEKDADGKYIRNAQTGLYLPGKANEVFASLVTKDKASTWEPMCVEEGDNTYTIKSNSLGQYLNAHSATNTGFWSAGASDLNSLWTVEEVTSVTVSIPVSGYYSVCYPMALDLPDGLTAYVVGEISNRAYGDKTYNYAVLDKVESNVIPAGMPVLLAGAPGTFKLSFHSGDADDIDMPNVLEGTTLKLNGIASNTGLYDAISTTSAGVTARIRYSSTTNIPANRAYMLKETIGVNTVYLQTRENLSTGIGEVEGDDADAVLYDVNGARVAKPESGRVYVTSDGKKVLVM